MKLPTRFNYVPVCAAILYGLTTPLGIAVGLGIRTTYNPGSTTASIVSGVLDALSAGILIYTGLVEVFFAYFFYIAKIDLSAIIATRSRVLVQQGDDKRFKWPTCLCAVLYVVWVRYHGSTGALGVKMIVVLVDETGFRRGI